MPCTAIKIEKDGEIKRVKFITFGHATHTDVDIYNCDEDFLPVGDPAAGVDKRLEAEYHIELRQEAHDRGQFIPGESTDPQWNPGYVEGSLDIDPEEILP